MSRSAFVTGATGFVGGHLVRELLAAGWQVTALARPGSPREGLAGLPVCWRDGDVTDPASLASAITPGTDCVFHVAASTAVWSGHRERQWAVNVDGTRNVIEAAVAAGAARLVHTSSFSVWGFVDGVLDETRPWRERDGWINYVRSKRAAEQLVKQAAAAGRIAACILNPAHILGPGDRRNWARMIRLLDAGQLPGVPSGGGAFAGVQEVARAHLRAAEAGRSGENYLLGGEDMDFIDLVGLAGTLLGKPAPRRPTPAWVLRAVARAGAVKAALTGREPRITPEAVAMLTHHVRVDSSKAGRELGYRTVPVRELLAQSCAWLRAEGLIA